MGYMQCLSEVFDSEYIVSKHTHCEWNNNIPHYVIVVLLAQYSNQQRHGAQYLRKRRREENQIHHENETANKKPEITKSKRRKLEKIKAPVTILREAQQEKGKCTVKNKLHFCLFPLVVIVLKRFQVPLITTSWSCCEQFIVNNNNNNNNK